MRLFKKREKRAEPTQTSFEDSLLMALLKKTEMTKDKAMQIPSVVGSISLIGNTIASTPIKLYEESVDDEGNNETKEVDDYRIPFLNDSTGDTMSASEMWRAVIEDYFLGKGAYIYINKVNGKVKSLHYVDEKYITIQENTDPIYKDYDINVLGKQYYPFDFIKILRNTKNGGKGKSIIEENDLLLSVAYNSLKFEDTIVRKGGNKKGFIKADSKLDQDAIDSLKSSWKKLYSNNEDNVVVLNNGLDFKESSNTSVEMQLNENKVTNSAELGKLFQVSPSLLNGTSATIKPQEEMRKFVKLAVLPIMKVIESALNEDLLLEKEKKSFYFAFDTKELMKGDAQERYTAYKTAIDSKLMTIDEARYLEDMKPLGLDFINLGLGAVLYNIKTKEIFIANTGKTENIDNLKVGGESETSIEANNMQT